MNDSTDSNEMAGSQQSLSATLTRATTLKRHTFDRLWNVLKICYERNGRSIVKAYGYLEVVDKLYGTELSGVEVTRVVLTNSIVDRPERRDTIVKTSFNDRVFYAIFTLVPRQHEFMLLAESNWLTESRFFGRTATTTIEQRKFVARSMHGHRVDIRASNDNGSGAPSPPLPSPSSSDYTPARRVTTDAAALPAGATSNVAAGYSDRSKDLGSINGRYYDRLYCLDELYDRYDSVDSLYELYDLPGAFESDDRTDTRTDLPPGIARELSLHRNDRYLSEVIEETEDDSTVETDNGNYDV